MIAPARRSRGAAGVEEAREALCAGRALQTPKPLPARSFSPLLPSQD
jgi:hypothetical protein